MRKPVAAYSATMLLAKIDLRDGEGSCMKHMKHPMNIFIPDLVHQAVKQISSCGVLETSQTRLHQQ
jgi:hypothetical protein